jgi:hypothetical protein
MTGAETCVLSMTIKTAYSIHVSPDSILELGSSSSASMTILSMMKHGTVGSRESLPKHACIWARSVKAWR